MDAGDLTHNHAHYGVTVKVAKNQGRVTQTYVTKPSHHWLMVACTIPLR